MTDKEEKDLNIGIGFLGKVYDTEIIKLIKYLNEKPPINIKLATAIIGAPEPAARLIITLCTIMGVFKYDKDTEEYSISKGGKDIIDLAYRFGNMQYVEKKASH
jgi:hypothetical protein